MLLVDLFLRSDLTRLVQNATTARADMFLSIARLLNKECK